jgi:hypothetical protein
VYKSQILVVEPAIETAALMLGTDKSRGYCLEMISADFLGEASLENGNSGVLCSCYSPYSAKQAQGEEERHTHNESAPARITCV